MIDETIDMIATQDQTYAGLPIKTGARIRATSREARTLVALQRARHLNSDEAMMSVGDYETRVMTTEPRATRTYKRRDLSAK